MFLKLQRGSSSGLSFCIFHKHPGLSLIPSQQISLDISPGTQVPQAEKASGPKKDKSLQGQGMNPWSVGRCPFSLSVQGPGLSSASPGNSRLSK